MDKKKRNALMMTALSLIYAGLQLGRTPQELSLVNQTISLLIPLVGLVFALNLFDKKWRWSIFAGNLVIFLLMLTQVFLK
ncbi:hypothetical protein AWM75_07475 [Aerococcus urinaehominis]|uniref:Uncharacterized protein n=1 Tax=Aerococcus urinaehominis TaxID=128944 RepID=A0A0X8FM23_9LACT|nr:hypothetical protein [Aerococcus urinaehominis]AMB99813.1 hypothetical protein AWM75_07475 [Aerococcus urinaehominis]SDM60355.1 hypothetical protein SAMN04487985_1288 [Aerococcus urinaehominis]